jgi:transcription antitermination factor NusG
LELVARNRGNRVQVPLCDRNLASGDPDHPDDRRRCEVFGVKSPKFNDFKSADLSERGEALPQVGEIHGGVAASVVSTTFLPAQQLSQWFAVCTVPRHEKRVALFLAQRQVEHYLPLYPASHRWKNGCTAQLELPLFPGYLFVRIGPQQRIPVLGLPGVISFVGTRGGPSELNEREIETLRSGLHLQRAEPFPQLAIGERVRIKRGPLSGMAGVMVRNAAGVRVVLTVELLRQSIAVEVALQDVDPAEPRLSPSCPSKGNA